MTNTLQQRPKTNADTMAVVWFFILAYVIAWGTFGLIAWIAQQSGIESPQALMTMGETLQFEGVDLVTPGWLIYLLTRIADFAFSIAGIIMITITAGRIGLRQLWQRLIQWRIGWRWYVAGLLPLLLYGIATLFSGDTASADISPATISTALFSIEAGLLVSLFLRGAFGEEFGLRGFALPHLQQRMSSFRASLIIGVLWGAWHLPVLIGRDILSVVIFSIAAIGLSFIFTWLFNGSNGSLIPVLLFHATQNWEEGFETLFPGLLGTDWELISTLGLLVLGIFAGVIVWRNDRATNK